MYFAIVLSRSWDPWCKKKKKTSKLILTNKGFWRTCFKENREIGAGWMVVSWLRRDAGEDQALCRTLTPTFPLPLPVY